MLLRKPAVKAEFGYPSDTSITSAVNAGVLTTPVRLGTRSIGWPDYEIKAIVNARIAGKTDDDIRALVQRMHTQRNQLVTA